MKYENVLAVAWQFFVNRLNMLSFLLLGGLICSSFGILNGFPIVFSDTGTYLLSGLQWFVPTDRPIMYGIFINVTSLFGRFLWLPIITQGIIATYFVYILIGISVRKEENQKALTILVISLLTATTSLSWFSSQLVPDLFCALAPIALLCLYFEKDMSIRKVILIVLFFIINLSHATSMLMCLGLSVVMLVLSMIRVTPLILRRVLLIFMLSAVSYPLTMTMNYAISGNIQLVADSPLFLSAKLVDLGMLQNYLQEDPRADQYQIAAHVGDIKPEGNHFLWSHESVIHRIPRSTLKSELKAINKDILTDPRNFAVFMWRGIQQTGKLFMSGNREYVINSYLGQYVHNIFKQHYPDSLNAFEVSKQQQRELLPFLKVNFIMLWMSYIVIPICLIVFRKKISKEVWVLVLFLFTLLVINDYICGTLSTLTSRYHLRVSWVVVFSLFMIFLDLNKSKFDQC